jgi:hypothetical protein
VVTGQSAVAAADRGVELARRLQLPVAKLRCDSVEVTGCFLEVGADRSRRDGRLAADERRRLANVGCRLRRAAPHQRRSGRGEALCRLADDDDRAIPFYDRRRRRDGSARVR